METFYAYLAGLVDGEGYFAIIKQKDIAYRKGFFELPLLDVSSSYQEALLFIQKTLGYGKIYSQKYTNGHQTVYHLKFYTKNLRILLPLLIQYLIIKKEKAEEIQKWLQEHTKNLGKSN